MIKFLMVAFNLLLVATGGAEDALTIAGEVHMKHFIDPVADLDAVRARSSPDETAPQVCLTFFEEVNNIISDNPAFFQNVRSGNSIRRRFKQDVAACAPNPKDPSAPRCSSQTASNAIQGMWDLVLQQKEGLCRTDTFAPSVTDQRMRERFTADNYAI